MKTGRALPKENSQSKTKIDYPAGSLEAVYGYTIRKAQKSNELRFYWIEKDTNGNEVLHPIDTVANTQKWLTETAQSWNIDLDTLKAAKLKAKEESENTNDKTELESDAPFEIITNEVTRISPDSGIIEDRPYLGIWVNVKAETENEVKIKQAFYLLFNDGEITPGDTETLSKKDIYLNAQPVFTPPRMSIEIILNLADLEAVNLAKIYDNIMTQVVQYIEFDGKDGRFYTLVTLWIIATYYHKQFAAFPYLFLNALKQSGKTKLLDILNAVSYNAIFSPNMSTSALFRLTQSAGATTLLDETEELSDPDKKAEFKSLLLSGYKRGATVYRSEKGENDSFIPTPYDVYSPKALANINGLNDVLEDRCIPITMKRGRTLSIINKEVPPPTDEKWQNIRNDLTKLYFQEAKKIGELYTKLESIDEILSVASACCVGSVCLNRVQENKNLYIARNWQLWRPLFTIALYMKKNISDINFTYTSYTTYTTYTNPLEILLDVSVDLLTEKLADNNAATGESMLIKGMLLRVDIDDYYSPSDLITSANQFADNGYLPDWFNTTWVGRILSRIGFKDKRRVAKGIEYHLTPDSVRDIADRLNITLPEPFKLPQIKSKDPDAGWLDKWTEVCNRIERCHRKWSDISWDVNCNSEFRELWLTVCRKNAEEVTTKKSIIEPQESAIYKELRCHICHKLLNDLDWMNDEAGNAVHTDCYNDAKKAELDAMEGQ